MGETLDFARVLVVQDGRIVEDGVPAELAAAPSRYRDLLQAEGQLHNQSWSDTAWRRLDLRDGVLAPSKAETP